MRAGTRAKHGSARWKVCQRDTDPEVSLYPLFEVHCAGLKEVVKCMLELKVGFHEGEIRETQNRVFEADRLQRWDVILQIIHNVCVAACLIILMLVWPLQVQPLYALVFWGFAFAGFYFFSLPTLRSLILHIPPPEGMGAKSFIRRAYWFTQKYFLVIYPVLFVLYGKEIEGIGGTCYKSTTCCYREGSTIAGWTNTTVALCQDDTAQFAFNKCQD
jgi:hypothetical protein